MMGLSCYPEVWQAVTLHYTIGHVSLKINWIIDIHETLCVSIWVVDATVACMSLKATFEFIYHFVAIIWP